MDEKIKEEITNEENKKVTEKAKSKNAVIVLVLIGIALLIVVGIVIANMQKVENDVENNVNSNSEDNVQNIQDNAGVEIYQEVGQNKDEQQVEQEEKDESVTEEDNETTESKQPENEQQEQVKVDFDEIADKLFEAYGIKGEVDKLPQVTAEERPKYEKIWNDMVAEKNEELVQIIKEKYPTLSDKQAREYATKVFEYAKEYGLRIAKQSEQVIEDAKDAIESADRANAMAELSLKYAEVLRNHYQTDPTQSYKVNEEDLKILQQHVLEKSDGKYTVIIKQDNSGYDVVKTAN